MTGETVKNIYRLEGHQIDAVASVHSASFPNFFLTFLGVKFISLFYLGVYNSPDGISFVYIDDDRNLCGFIVGASNPRGFYSRMLKRDWWRFALVSLTSLVKRPSISIRLVRAIFHPLANPIGNDVAGLFSIGVSPQFQGVGAGRKLIEAFLDESKRRGCKKVFLTTDGNDNDLVNAFYVKCGFSLRRTFVTPEGRKMNEYWFDFSEENT